MNKRTKQVFVAAAVIAAAMAPGINAYAIPAFPGANNSCDVGDFCVWEAINLGGRLGDTPSAVQNYTQVGFWGRVLNANDQASSLWNRWGVSVSLYAAKDYGAEFVCIGPGQGAFNIGPGAWNDILSSHKSRTGSVMC